MKSLLAISNLSFSYGHKRILDAVNFSVDKAETVALLGANGAGKTTLLKVCAGLLAPDIGEIRFRGRPLSDYPRRDVAQKIALVPQEVQVSFHFTVQQLVEQGRTPHLPSLFAGLRQNDRAVVREAMDCADVGHLRNRSFNDLSGGERQRVKIALAIAQQPELLLLDEPTQHLDIGRQAEVFGVLRRLNESGVTIIAAIHDLESARAQFASGILLCPDSSAVCGPIANVLTAKLIREAFGVSLSERDDDQSTGELACRTQLQKIRS
jgi:ABC-type cobalamin/Fe3+-siderophores transport system ATPase subunit